MGALGGGSVVAHLLFGLAPTDPTTVVMAIGSLVAVAAVATYVPVKKIASITPTAVLRND